MADSPFKQTDKFNPFDIGTSTYDVSSNPSFAGNYYEGGTPTISGTPTINRGKNMIGIPRTLPGQLNETSQYISQPHNQYANMDNMPTGDGRYGRTKMGILSQNIGGALGKLGAGVGGKLSNAQQMGMIGGVMGIAQGLIGRKKRRAQQRAAKNEYQTRRTEFENLDTSNLSAGFKNSYANMENTYEDLTVNQQQAQFQAQQNQQSQANIMQNLRGAAGGSGIGGLAQALANQSQIANQKASASIGMQESANQRLAAQGAAQVQQMGAQGEIIAQQQRISGAGIARGLQADKTGTLLGMAQADKAAADQAIQESNAALFGGIGSIAGAAAIGGINSLLKPQQPS